ncbi:DNA methyltransferase [Pseudoalteromonas sp. APC 3218]|uniref:DNA methyltransferase n=1 Tax=Pseudoalteromonas sp. APC 3218 TaxID=3035180 RepID=UPI0025B39002|nr:DNA methyltransferase [Pseudoalteromonas sp. APC 3218]MDN3407099.1 DNA methyltransferase [Pseudoalteromonas sp. APC 3218]
MATQELKDKFVDLLKSMFQLDQPELDFGLYKIMHSKADRINKFLDTELNQQIDEIFSDAQQADKKKEIEEAKQNVIASIGEMAFDENGNLTEAFKTTPAAQSYLSVISSQETAKDNLSERGVVYDHLIRFFSRYYDGGDFMSRRYHVAESDKKAAPYAVPYDGSEVNLHWANKDQYYIKTTESFNNYSFDIAESINQAQQTQGAFDFAPQLPSKAIHFKLVDVAEGEHNNNKETEKRVFFLHLDEPIVFNEKNELVVQFEYRNATKNDALSKEQEANLKQKYLAQNKGDLPLLFICDAVEGALKNEVNTELTKDYLEFIAIISKTEKIKNRPLLFKYLKNFVLGNTMDYFIHKNLKSFLQRELDFYIKNEIIKLDDVEQADAPAVEMWLKLVKSLRKVASEIIQFLAQLEDFQKKLWLKKKFVTETNYCFTIDKLESHPELLELVLNNEKQKQEWKEYFKLDLDELNLAINQSNSIAEILNIANMKFLVVDTKFLSEYEKDLILSHLDNLETEADGFLVNADNAQGLRFVSEKYQGKIDNIYIDPPYNTGGDGFIYKDNYQHSSWLSMFFERLEIAKNLQADNSWFSISINDKENHRMLSLIESIYSEDNLVSNVCVKMSHMSGMKMAHIDSKPPKIKEYLTVFNNAEGTKLNPIYEQAEWDDVFDRYKSILTCEPTEDVSTWTKAPLTGYAKEQGIDIKDHKQFESFKIKHAHRIFRTATNDSDTFRETEKDGKFYKVKTPTGMFKVAHNREEVLFCSEKMKEIDGVKVPVQPKGDIWEDIGINNLHNEGGVTLANGKKPVKYLERIVTMLGKTDNSFTLDYFAGSGTTAHAVMNLNRKDEGSRKYLLLEMGNHFDNITLRRVKNCIYSKDWKNETPLKGSNDSYNGISHFLKYVRLESYEDTLNNLLESKKFDLSIIPKEFTLGYLLDAESQGSKSMLNISEFSSPRDYTLNIKQPNSDQSKPQNIDLIETFNWLIGLTVDKYDPWCGYECDFEREQDPDLPEDQNTRLKVKGRLKQVNAYECPSTKYQFRTISGFVPRKSGNDDLKDSVLIIWRKLSDNLEEDAAVLEALLEKLQINQAESQYDRIYINGPHGLQLHGAAKTRLINIEEAFTKAMWAGV